MLIDILSNIIMFISLFAQSFYVLSLEERTKESKSSKAIFVPNSRDKTADIFRFMRLSPSANAIPAQNAAIAAEDLLW